MKLRFIFLLFLIVFMFSCAGTPKSDDAPPDSSQQDSPVEEIDESPELEDFDDKLLADKEITDEITDETTETEIADNSLSEDAAVVEQEETAEEIAVADSTKQDEPVVEAAAIEPQPMPVVEPAQPPAQPPSATPAQIAREPVPVPGPTFPPPASPDLAEEKPDDSVEVDVEQDDAQERQVGIPPRYEPPVVSAVRDDDSLPVRSGLTARNDEIIFSRTVRAVVGQIVEIPFRGNNWVYLGEIAARRGIVFSSRQLDNEGQSFIFRAEKAGAYVLKFYRRDHIRDYIINDHVQVIVEEALSAGAGLFNPPYDRGRVTAQPRWPSALEEAELQRREAAGLRPAADDSGKAQSDDASQERAASGEPLAYVESASGRLVQRPTPTQKTDPVQGDAAAQGAVPAQSPKPQPSQASSSADNGQVLGVNSAQSTNMFPEKQESLPAAVGAESGENLPPETILQRAKETFDEGNIAAAIALLDQYAGLFPGGTDELYWYYGQFYEANSPSRNILLSLDYYRRLVNEYPQSSRLNDARRRIAYLERFYINIQ